MGGGGLDVDHWAGNLQNDIERSSKIPLKLNILIRTKHLPKITVSWRIFKSSSYLLFQALDPAIRALAAVKIGMLVGKKGKTLKLSSESVKDLNVGVAHWPLAHLAFRSTVA